MIVAYMDEFVDPDLLGLRCDEDFDSEGLMYYKSTKARLSKRGLLGSPTKPSKPVFKAVGSKEGAATHETPYWEDKGDIT